MGGGVSIEQKKCHVLFLNGPLAQLNADLLIIFFQFVSEKDFTAIILWLRDFQLIIFIIQVLNQTHYTVLLFYLIMFLLYDRPFLSDLYKSLLSFFLSFFLFLFLSNLYF